MIFEVFKKVADVRPWCGGGGLAAGLRAPPKRRLQQGRVPQAGDFVPSLCASGGLGHQGMHPQAVQSAEVAGEGHQIPFKADFGLPPQEKSPEAHGGFDDADDGLDGLLPLFV